MKMLIVCLKKHHTKAWICL